LKPFAMLPRFSIVTVSRRDRAGLARTHASVVAQSCTDFEWLVIDGNSADGTIEYLRQVHRQNCHWVSEPDRGLYDAMNKGLEWAKGQYVIFMNSGDRLADPEVLARIDALLAQNGPEWDLLFGDAYEEAADGQLWLKPARPVAGIRYGMFTHHQAMLYARRGIAGRRYNCGFVVAADYHFTCRLLTDGGTSFRLGFPVSINTRSGWSEKKAATGRRENLAIQRDVLQLGAARRAANYAAFLGSGFLRTHLRGLYDRMRFRRPPVPGSCPPIAAP
jgi:putative colanic acid biosynthesis glycosyltransferase